MKALTVSLAVLAATIVAGAAWQLSHQGSAQAEPTAGLEVQIKPVTPPPPPPESTDTLDVGITMDDIRVQPVIVPLAPGPVTVRIASATKPPPTEQDGYDWAADRGVYTHRECAGHSEAFAAGCHSYVLHIQSDPNG